jgi:hypothetical protein
MARAAWVCENNQFDIMLENKKSGDRNLVVQTKQGRSVPFHQCRKPQRNSRLEAARLKRVFDTVNMRTEPFSKSFLLGFSFHAPFLYIAETQIRS